MTLDCTPCRSARRSPRGTPVRGTFTGTPKISNSRWLLVGRCEVVQSLLTPMQLCLPSDEAFGDGGEFGTEIRAQFKPRTLVTLTGAVEVAFDGDSVQPCIDHGLDLRNTDDVLLVIITVACTVTFRDKQTALLVVAQRAGAGPRFLGEFADLHCWFLSTSLTFTLASGCTFLFVTSFTTLQNAFIFHGYAAEPNDHWFGWLAQQLDTVNIRAVVPALPDSLSPDAPLWQDTVRTAVGEPSEDTVMIAHSLGCLAVLRHLASLTGAWRIGSLVLVAGFLDPLPVLPELDSFIGSGCDVTGLREHIDRVIVIRSDNDALVPPAHTDRLAGLLGVETVVVPGAGHFLAADGHSTLPAAYDAIVA